MENKIEDIYRVRRVKGEIGIEIELEGKRLPTRLLPESWVYTRDGSLRGEGGIEYLLKVPIARKNISKILKELARALQSYPHVDMQPSNRCGVHVHINCQKLTVEEVLKFSILYYIFEDVLLKYCGNNRVGNLFCLSATDAEAVLEALSTVPYYGNFNSLQDNKFRYAALNFTALSKFGSLEFRGFRSTKNFVDIVHWINILIKLKDGLHQFNNCQEIVECFSRLGPDRFALKIFGERYWKELKVKFKNKERMLELMYNSAQSVQFIAYHNAYMNSDEIKDKIANVVNIGRRENIRDDAPDDADFEDF